MTTEAPWFVFRFPKPTPSQNRLRKMHHHAYAQLRDDLVLSIRAQLGRRGIHALEKPHTRVVIEVHRWSSGVLDKGNFIGGCKALLDALTRSNVLQDDSPKWLEDRYHQHPTPPKQGRTEVVVWRVQGAPGQGVLV